MKNSIFKGFNNEKLVFLFALAITISAFFLNDGSNVPVIHADEGSYLANAAAIAGFKNDMVNNYHAGYSIIISPAFFFANSPSQVWILVKVINATLLGVSFVVLNLLTKMLAPQRPFFQRAGLSCLVTLYPMWTALSSYAMSENAYVPIYILIATVFLLAIKKGQYYWFVLGILAGFLYWTHPKAMVVLLSMVISLFYLSYRQKRLAGPAVTFFTIIFMVVVYRLVFVPWIEYKMTISGLPFDGYKPTISLVLAPLFSVAGIKNTFTMLTGQLFYLSLGTLGIIWVGIVNLYQNFVDKRQFLLDFSDEEVITFSLFLLLSFVGTLLLSSLFMGGMGDLVGAFRLDQLMYGRYNESVIAPLLLIGLLSKNYRFAAFGWGVGFIYVIVRYQGMGQFNNTAPINVTTFWQEFYLRDQGVSVWFITGALLILLVVSLPRRIVLPMVGLFFIFCSYQHMKNFHIGASNYAVNKVRAADYVRKHYKAGVCVGFDYSGVARYSTGVAKYSSVVFWYDLSFALFDYQFQKLSFKKWLKSCDGPFFSYSKNLNLKADVYSPVSLPYRGPLLWVKK